MKYSASTDKPVKIISTGVLILFLFIGQNNVRTIIHAGADRGVILIHAAILLFLVATLLFCYLYAPQSYSIDETGLSVNRIIGKINLKFDDLDQVRAVEEGEMNGLIRTFGVGGLFGYFGKYYANKIGNMTLYATQRKNRILIITKQHKKIVITPDDRSMLEKLEQGVKGW
ncbi:PH domain-containing protein [Pedobacter montanisoli]|uniref:PH domain-containing protein n=1 Tax=Pedobacter montanisoli TaxID=2923277 RepID=A0ABS9ZX40_9SPHI|nr:PH domain-containing protein [Pedobacter montanisoli]MCJ0742884.1 PH domain-containing protein [Pedobacter montanisoli]